MKITEKDKVILRQLATEIANIAGDPSNKTNAQAWTKLNGNEKGAAPLLWINEIPWHEINVNDELTLKCSDPFCRGIEDGFRMKIYQWRHMRGHMVVERVFYSHLVISDTGFGIQQNTESVEGESTTACDFKTQMTKLSDVEKIKMPVVTLDKMKTEENYQVAKDIFGDILEVKKYGIGQQWFTLWDNLIRWYGIEEAMVDLILKPELVHAALDRLLKAFICRLEQYEKLNVLSLDNGPFRVGSGGYGYIDELPAKGFKLERVRTIDQWGCANAQIFSEVSPEMHEEFSLRYDREWLKRFGITYYGCCEPLHTKVGILKSIPNLRKVSISPKADIDRFVEQAGDQYILSYKPNPAIFAPEAYNDKVARAELESALEKAQGCRVEMIMKDITTVKNDPRRLWKWSETAMEILSK